VASSDDAEEPMPPTPPGSCSGDSEESRSPKGSAPSSPQQRLHWQSSPVMYYSTPQQAATVLKSSCTNLFVVLLCGSLTPE